MNAASTETDTLYLIDGSGFIFRAFHALPDLTRPDGTHIGAVLGFCNMMHKLLDEVKAENIAVIFDAARRTFRNEIYPDYKAHRPPPPPELIPQFALIREATRAFGVPALEMANFEADDLIASYAKEAELHGRHVRIVSSDKDLMQLIRPGVDMYDPMKSMPIGLDEVMKKFGVTPDKVTDVQALAGDSTDNIPGVPGIGVKTAAELINQFGDLESLLKAASSIKQPKRREVLLSHAEAARISKRLVVLDEMVPLPLPLHELKKKIDHKADLIVFLQAQGFRTLLTRLGAPQAERIPVVSLPSPSVKSNSVDVTAPLDSLMTAKADYELVQDQERLKWWVEAARAAGCVAIDTETDSLTASTAKLVGISLAIAPGKACYIPCQHIDPQATPVDKGGFVFDQPHEPS